MSWDEYAALTRHLGAVRQAAADKQSAGRREQDAARERADRLDARLAAQRQRLAELGAWAGQSTAALSAPVTPAISPPGPPSWPGQPVPGQPFTGQPFTGQPFTGQPLPGQPLPGQPFTGQALPGQPAAAIGGPSTPALPAPADPPALTSAPHPTGSPGAVHVPAQRTGPPPVLATPTPAPQPHGDPAAILAAAEGYADTADQAAAQAEAAAVRPALLPTATPLVRSLAAYGGCAAAAMVAQSGLLLVKGGAVVGATFSLAAWMCTGLPALAFFGGFVVLSIWGKPAVDDGRPVERHARIGFAICFLALPVVVCGYLALIQLITG